MVITYGEHSPRIDPSAWVQVSAHVIGDVEIGALSSVWFNVVIRGDVYPIRIGARTNIQDNSTIHVTGGRWATSVGDDVTVGHGVILHGCRIADRCLIGIGAILLDGVEVESDSLIAAGSLVVPGTRIPSGPLVKGSPAQVARPLRAEELVHLRESAAGYVERAVNFARST